MLRALPLCATHVCVPGLLLPTPPGVSLPQEDGALVLWAGQGSEDTQGSGGSGSWRSGGETEARRRAVLATSGLGPKGWSGVPRGVRARVVPGGPRPSWLRRPAPGWETEAAAAAFARSPRPKPRTSLGRPLGQRPPRGTELRAGAWGPHPQGGDGGPRSRARGRWPRGGERPPPGPCRPAPPAGTAAATPLPPVAGPGGSAGPGRLPPLPEDDSPRPQRAAKEKRTSGCALLMAGGPGRRARVGPPSTGHSQRVRAPVPPGRVSARRALGPVQEPAEPAGQRL